MLQLSHGIYQVAQDAMEERVQACNDLRRALDEEQRSWLESQHERATEEATALELRLREAANARRDAEIKAWRQNKSMFADLQDLHAATRA